MSESVVSKAPKEWLQLLVGTVVIALIAYLVFNLTKLFLDFLSQVDPTVGAAIIASMTTILVGLGGALGAQYQIKMRQADETHREEKIRLYSKFLEMAASHLAQENKNLNQRWIPEKELVKFFFEFKTGIILRGSPGVIRALAIFEGVSASNGDVLGAVDGIYREIRKDIGLSNSGLKSKELVAVYLKHEDRDTLLR